MPATQIRGTQVQDGTIQRADVDTTTSAKALITKVLDGQGIKSSASGVDAGTGDVTVAIDQTGANPVTTFYIGTKARLVQHPTLNGLRLEVKGTDNNWYTAADWTHA